MRKFKNSKLILLLLASMFILILAGCGNKTNATDSKVTLKSADVVSSTSPYTEGMKSMAEKVKERTDGKVDITHYPDGQLGDDNEIVEGMKIGSIDMSITGYSGYDPLDDLFYLPYIFEDYDHQKRVIDSELGQQIIDDYEEKMPNYKLIGFVYYAPRILTTKGVEVVEPADLARVKVRVPESAMSMDTWKALGATATPVAFTELFTSLQSGVVNAQENPYEIVVNNSFYEVQDTVIETNHALPVRFMIMNKKKYESLTNEQQEVISDVWEETSAEIEEMFIEKESEYIEFLKDKGMKFVKPNIDAFTDATTDIWKDYIPEVYGEDFYDKIQKLRSSGGN